MNTESTLQRLVRKALTSKRQHFNADGTPKDLGVGVTGVVVTIVILGILAAVGGPPLFSLIFDAREFKLENNVQEAAQIVQQRLTLEPDWMGPTGVNSTAGLTEGMPTTDLQTAFVEDSPYTWANDQWIYGATDGDETIRVQFLTSALSVGASNAAAKTALGTQVLDVGAPPGADWIGSNWKAVRLHARNSDGRWACALIVIQPEVIGSEANQPGRYHSNAIPADISGASSDVDRQRLGNAWMAGIWYDSGDVIQAAGLDDCSPVEDGVVAAGKTVALPENANVWEIEPEPNPAGAEPVRTLRRAL